jgi:4-carboxymuconolactone decarboxylase
MKRSHVAALSATAVAFVAMVGLSGVHAAGEKEKRFKQLTMEDLNPAQKALAPDIMKISSVGLAGPYNPMMRSPEMGRYMFDLMGYLRQRTSVPIKLNELAILIVGREWRSQVEWYAHVPIAMKNGLPQHVIDDLRQKRRPAQMAPDEAIVYDFVTELLQKHEVSDVTFAAAKKLLGEQGVVDLTAVSGTYVLVAAMLAMAEEMPPAGKELQFKPSDP